MFHVEHFRFTPTLAMNTLFLQSHTQLLLFTCTLVVNSQASLLHVGFNAVHPIE